MKLKLNNNDVTVNVLDSSTATTIQAECASAEEMEQVREMLTKDALSDFQFLTDEDKLIGSYQHCVLDDITYSVTDGMYQVSLHLRQLSDTEVRLDALEDGQELQNGGIDELAEIVGGEE